MVWLVDLPPCFPAPEGRKMWKTDSMKTQWQTYQTIGISGSLSPIIVQICSIQWNQYKMRFKGADKNRVLSFSQAKKKPILLMLFLGKKIIQICISINLNDLTGQLRLNCTKAVSYFFNFVCTYFL